MKLIYFKEYNLQTMPYYHMVNSCLGTCYQWHYEGSPVSPQFNGYNKTCNWLVSQTKYLPSQLELYKIHLGKGLAIKVDEDYSLLDEDVINNRIVALNVS